MGWVPLRDFDIQDKQCEQLATVFSNLTKKMKTHNLFVKLLAVNLWGEVVEKLLPYESNQETLKKKCSVWKGWELKCIRS